MNEKSYIAYTVKIANDIVFYLSITCLPIGIISNLFSIFIFTRKNFRKNKMSHLSCWIILFDTASVIVGFTLTVFLPIIGVDLYKKSGYSCMILTYIRRILAQSASWSQAFCTFDRFLSIKYINQIDLLKKKGRNLFIITVIMVGVLSIINITNLNFKLESTNKNNVTQITCTASSVILLAADLESILMRNFLPFSAMFILNVIVTKDFLQLKGKFENKKKVNVNYNLHLL